jgi:hypothetical protein
MAKPNLAKPSLAHVKSNLAKPSLAKVKLNLAKPSQAKVEKRRVNVRLRTFMD